jgi:hypothetical protein
MKKLFFIASLALSAYASTAQEYVFGKLLENKLLCKEDRLVNFLETNSFKRSQSTFHREYSFNGESYFTDIVFENDCYAIYRTNSRTEYKNIEKHVREMCDKEVGPDNAVYYGCNIKRMYGAQVFLTGLLSREGVYEIKIFQNPKWEEDSYPAVK